MKKILSNILVFFILFSSVMMPIRAINSEEYYISDIQIIVCNEEGVENTFTYHSDADQTNYLVKDYNDRIELYNADTNVLISTATRTVKEESILKLNETKSSKVVYASAEDYEKWGNYLYYKTDSLHIGGVSSLTVSQIAGLLNGWLGWGLSGLTGLATIIYNNEYEGVYAKIYLSANVYCNILAKTRYNFYAENSGAFLKTDDRGTSWYGSPWDYTQPAACRVLAQKY